MAWISVTDAAKATGYGRKQIRRLLQTGAIKGRKVVTVWQIDRGSLLAYVQKARNAGAKRGPKPKA